jgi:hypothetical protein
LNWDAVGVDRDVEYSLEDKQCTELGRNLVFLSARAAMDAFRATGVARACADRLFRLAEQLMNLQLLIHWIGVVK